MRNYNNNIRSSFSVMAFLIVVLSFVSFPLFATGETPQFKNDPHSTEYFIYRILFLLIIVSAIAYGVAFAIKRYYFGAVSKKFNNSDIKVIGIKRVSASLTIFHLEIDERKIYLAQSGTNLVILRESEDIS